MSHRNKAVHGPQPSHLGLPQKDENSSKNVKRSVFTKFDEENLTNTI